MVDSNTGDLLIRWTARAAVACYFLALAMRLGGAATLERATLARSTWTLGGLSFLLHLAAAFHFLHHWSHQEAYDHIAQRTAEVVGWRFGAGIFVNYAFGLVWLADVLWWWVLPLTYATRPRWITLALHAFLAFIVLNATVVFGEGAIRWFGAAGFTGLAILWTTGRKRTSPQR